MRVLGQLLEGFYHRPWIVTCAGTWKGRREPLLSRDKPIIYQLFTEAAILESC